MPEIQETPLPGVGVRHEFSTDDGQRVAVVTHRSGRREVSVYDRADPDASTTVLNLSVEDARALTEILGGSQVSETVAAVQQRIEGLAIEWLTIPPSSRFATATIGDGEFRTRTGVSIVAVVRGSTTVPAPGPDFGFAPGDVAVAVGTPEGLAQMHTLLDS